MKSKLNKISYLLSAISVLVILSFFKTNCLAQTYSRYIVVDQFGYLPESEKIAVIRDPQTGYDSNDSFAPGNTYAVVHAATETHVYSNTLETWNEGAEDVSSGDKAWWFDFSSVTEPGEYYVLDIDNNVRSYSFKISIAVYNEVLKHAMRTFFYQRAGFEKNASYADKGWTDGASHLGPLQDKNCRIFDNANNADTEKDLSGGWYDAGDFNKYTNWTANYVVEMMKAYLENPVAWDDNYNIPESGNDIPDIIDEVKWGIDHLLRMQQSDGSVLTIVGLSHASPPSSATGQSLYGPASTSASLNTAAAFAISSKVFSSLGVNDYADTLQARSIKAWGWAVANPDVLFRNNDADYNSIGLGAGQQEESDYQRAITKLEAACFLFELTGDPEYHDYFEANYQESHLIQWNYAYPFEAANQEALLYYASLPGAGSTVSDNILLAYENSMNTSSDNFPAYYNQTDPYQAHLKDYTWGSNSIKACKGNMFYNVITFDIDNSKLTDARIASEKYLHYLHGVNPFNMTYLSNMYKYGGNNCVNEFYHTWFTNGSPDWDRVGVSAYGPAPGFLTGGPNPSYDWDGCCPGSCGSSNNNALCTSESISPPKDQPKQKSYKDFNTSWPLNSWSVTENSCGYQANYIRLLSKFADASYDCNGDKDGTAFFDVCGQCAGGNTGIVPITDPSECPVLAISKAQSKPCSFEVYPNPVIHTVSIKTSDVLSYNLKIFDTQGTERIIKECHGNTNIDVSMLPSGNYMILILYDNQYVTFKILIQ